MQETRTIQEQHGAVVAPGAEVRRAGRRSPLRRAMLAFAMLVAAFGVQLAMPSAAHAADNCPIYAGPNYGEYQCKYEPTLVQWPDGHLQWFVVGTTGSVYDAYEYNNNWSTWRNLGGQALSSVDVDYLSSTRIDISVIGTYNGWWCKRWTSTGGWTNWWDCY